MWVEFMYNILVDCANRPYLGWIFNESSDNHTANCLWQNSRMDDLVAMFSEANFEEKKQLILNVDCRGYSIRVKDRNHFEFRFFDMVRCERDLKDHLKFVSAYMAYIEKKTLVGEHVEPKKLKLTIRRNFWDKVEYYNYPKKKAILEFKNLLKDLGLDYKDYRRFVERNYLVRLNTYPKSYLV